MRPSVAQLAEEVGAELLRPARARIGTPMDQVAHGLGVRVIRAPLPMGARGFSLRADRTVFIRPSGYAPRDEFSIAHELVELHAPWRALPERLQEKLCDRAAGGDVAPEAAIPLLAAGGRLGAAGTPPSVAVGELGRHRDQAR